VTGVDSRALTMLSWGVLGGCAQSGNTPLCMASQNGHKEVVKLLLAHADVKVNQATKVRGRREGSVMWGEVTRCLLKMPSWGALLCSV
jgi:hypothetical protein